MITFIHLQIFSMLSSVNFVRLQGKPYGVGQCHCLTHGLNTDQVNSEVFLHFFLNFEINEIEATVFHSYQQLS